MKYLLSFIVVIMSIFVVIFWFKLIGLEGNEISIIFYIIIFFFVVLPVFMIITYIFNDTHTDIEGAHFIIFPILGFLVPSYYILFKDINCNLIENQSETIFRIAYNDMINDIVHFNSKNKTNRGKDYMKNICKDYHHLQKEVEEKSKIDYEDNVVNSLIFDIAYNKNYYQIKDIGEKEYKRKQLEIINEIDFLIK